MDKNETLHVAIVGYGLAGAVFHAPLIDSTPGMTVAAIVTQNAHRSAQAHADYPNASILPVADDVWNNSGKYDLVVIASSNRSHVPLALAAIDAGLPVVVDKPLALSVAEAEAVINRSRDRNVPVTVFQNRRWDGDFLTVRQIIERNVLGTLVRYESRFERYRPAPNKAAWRESPDPADGGGLLLDLGSHLIDAALTLFGTPLSVYAEIGALRPGAEVDDDTFIALAFENKLHAHLWMNTTVRTPGPRFKLVGLRGTYTKFGLDPQEPALKAGVRPGDAQWGTEPSTLWGSISTDVEGLHLNGTVETIPGAYEAYYAAVRDALQGGTRLPVDPRDALATLRVIESARASMQRREAMQLH